MGPLRAASMPRGRVRDPPGTDARRNGPMDAAKRPINNGLSLVMGEEPLAGLHAEPSG
jgi:hypothetical protein